MSVFTGSVHFLCGVFYCGGQGMEQREKSSRGDTRRGACQAQKKYEFSAQAEEEKGILIVDFVYIAAFRSVYIT